MVPKKLCANDRSQDRSSQNRKYGVKWRLRSRSVCYLGCIWLFLLLPNAKAQFTVSDLERERASAEEVAEKAIEIGEKSDSLSTQLSIYNVGEKIYSTNVSNLDFSIKSYNFHQKMDTAPASDYSSYENSGVKSWPSVAASNNTYGNSQQWLDAASTAAGSAAAVQSVSVPSIGQLSGYTALASDGKEAIAAVGSTIELEDAATATSLQTLGTARLAATQRELDISTLEQSTHSSVSSEQTVMSELQRVNQALILRLRGEQELMELQQAQDIHRLLHKKARLDALKTAMAAAMEFEHTYASFKTANTLRLTGSGSH